LPRHEARKVRAGVKERYRLVYRILNNPFYAGIPQREGKTYPGKHEAMVTLDQFDRVQEFLGHPGKQRPKTREFAFTGLIRCGACGLSVTAAETVTRSTRPQDTYSISTLLGDKWVLCTD
jgi:site-specific DNA recombinase